MTKAKLSGLNDLNYSLKDKSIVLPISLGQIYHEGEKFEATCRVVNRRFGHCDIILADTLQRADLSDRNPNSLDNLHQQQEGDAWLERNKGSFRLFDIPMNILRWSDLIANPEFNETLKSLMSKYDTDRRYRQSILDDSIAYIARKRTGDNTETEELLNNSKVYLFEETAVYLTVINNQYDFLAYPSTIPNSIKYIKTGRETIIRIYFKG